MGGVMAPIVKVAPRDGRVLRTIHIEGVKLVGPRLELADGSLAVDSLPLVPNNPSGIGIVDPLGAFHWLLRMPTDEVLAASPDQTSVFATRKDSEERIELVSVPREGSISTPLGGSGVTARKGMVFSPNGRSVVWSDCNARLSAARLDGAGRLADLAPSSTWTDTFVASIGGGSRVAIVSNRSGADALWVVDLDDAQPARMVPTGGATPIHVAASPDGRSIAYSTDHGIQIVAIDGATPPRALTSKPEDIYPTFRHDGKAVVFASKDSAGDEQVMVVELDGSLPRALLPPGTTFPVASPVDASIVYLTGRSGAFVAMVLDPSGRTRRLSTKLAPMSIKNVPAFDPDGKRIGFVKNTGESFIEVDVSTGAIVREIDPEPDTISAAAYTSKGLLFTRTTWVGDLWAADDPF